MSKSCNLCPRQCNIDRASSTGFCGEGEVIRISRADLHFWEEPCISGKTGSGAVFFTGCNLKCIYCQNAAISENGHGKQISAEDLADIFFELKHKGACNINLVTPSHFVPGICEAIRLAKDRGFDLPFIYNSSAYENVETLHMLDGLINVYLPDLKYLNPKKAEAYSHAPDYPDVAKSAIAEMYRQTGQPVFLDGLIKKGVIVRHLVLPLNVKGAIEVIDYLYDTYTDNIFLSVMNQYTPLYGIEGALSELQKKRLEAYPELRRKLTKREYERVIAHCTDRDITNAFIQEGDVASDSFIPDFNL